MNHSISFMFRLLSKGFLPALLLWLSAVHLSAEPVFELVHGFALPPDGPHGRLIQGSDGNFYGTTSSGGGTNEGTVFKMTPAVTLTTLVHFDYFINGSHPYAGLIQGSDGNFYGTTSEGGTTSDGQYAGGGQIYRLRMEPPVGMSFAEWPVLTTLPAERRGPLDRNGPLDLQNLMVFAMGLSPLSAAPADLPALVYQDLAGGTATFRYRRAKNIIGTTLSPVTSTNLTAWNTAMILNCKIAQDGGDWEVVDVLVPAPPGGRLFFQLRAE